MKLTDSDKQSALWLRLKAHLNELINQAQRDNEKKLSLEDTCYLRGRIKVLRQLEKLDQMPKDIASKETPDY